MYSLRQTIGLEAVRKGYLAQFQGQRSREACLQQLCSHHDSQRKDIESAVAEKQTRLQVFVSYPPREMSIVTLLLRRTTMARQRWLHLEGRQRVPRQTQPTTTMVESSLGTEVIARNQTDSSGSFFLKFVRANSLEILKFSIQMCFFRGVAKTLCF